MKFSCSHCSKSFQSNYLGSKPLCYEHRNVRIDEPIHYESVRTNPEDLTLQDIQVFDCDREDQYAKKTMLHTGIENQEHINPYRIECPPSGKLKKVLKVFDESADVFWPYCIDAFINGKYCSNVYIQKTNEDGTITVIIYRSGKVKGDMEMGDYFMSGKLYQISNKTFNEACDFLDTYLDSPGEDISKYISTSSVIFWMALVLPGKDSDRLLDKFASFKKHKGIFALVREDIHSLRKD